MCLWCLLCEVFDKSLSELPTELNRNHSYSSITVSALVTSYCCDRTLDQRRAYLGLRVHDARAHDSGEEVMGGRQRKWLYFNCCELFSLFFVIFDMWITQRQCATNQYLRKENDPHRYCTGECAVHTKCGPVIVPEEHLQVSPRTHRLSIPEC